MKKLIVIMLTMAVAIGVLAGCGKKESAQPTTEQPETANQETIDTPTEENEEESEIGFSFSELSDTEFTFSSGAGGWSTWLSVKSDGTFEGQYHDSEMGDIDDEAPNGACYLCDFTGKFSQPEKVDEYTYAVTIESIELDQEPGTEEVKDGIRYIYSEPYGLDGADQILIYLPGIKLADLPEAYLSWMSGAALDTSIVTELPFYGLYNVASECGFFSDELGTDTSNDIDAELAEVEEKAAVLEAKLLETDMNQSELNATSSELYSVWDDELNSIWNRIKDKLDDDTMNQLLTEQRAWVSDKEEAVQAAGAAYEGGSMQPLEENSKATELTRDRVYELAEYLR